MAVRYVSTDKLRTVRVEGEVVDLSAYSDAELLAKIELAENIVDRITGGIFNFFRKTISFDGSGLTRLFFLPEITNKLLEVVSVKEIDFDSSTLLYTYTEDDDFKRYDWYLETARRYTGEGTRRRFNTGGVWARGQKNIEIDGYWGYSDIEAGVGTVKVTTGALTTVVGVSTQFISDFVAGDLIRIDGTWYTISSITNNTTLVISTNYGGTLGAVLAYYHSKVPIAIKEAVILLAIEMTSPGLVGLSRSDARRIVWDDFEVTFKGDPTDLGGATGYAEVDRLLINYVNHASMFLVIPDTKQGADRAH